MTPDFPTLTAIVAMANNRTIGLDGKIPWHSPADLKRFKAATMGRPVIVGHETYKTLPPLPGRRLIVVSKSKSPTFSQELAFVNSIDGAFQTLERWNIHPLDGIVIGGQQIYEMFMPHVRTILMTIIERDYEGDRFFPFDPTYDSDWDTESMVSGKDYDAPRDQELPLLFTEYRRDNSPASMFGKIDPD